MLYAVKGVITHFFISIYGVIPQGVMPISDKGDLITYWRAIFSEGDFLGTPPSYTLFKDLMLRLCHRLITCSIDGRSQVLDVVCFKEEVGDYDIWRTAWVALGPERHTDDAASTPKAIEEASSIDKGASADLAPMQAPQPPHAAPGTMP
nr:hypothetical protein [Tanacetum cinerariifolium]